MHIEHFKDSVIFEDNHLLIINKRAGWLSQGDKTGDDSVIERAKLYIKHKYEKPGAVFMGLAHRLDRPVSGALILCRTSKALTRMNDIIKSRQIEKVYHAICMGRPIAEKGSIKSYLIKNSVKNKVASYDKPKSGAKEAVLNYKLLKVLPKDLCLIEVRLQTGRPHQIRVQLKSIDCPILGDLKYHPQKPLPDKSIALHARSIKFIHPVRKEPIEIEASYPSKNWWH